VLFDCASELKLSVVLACETTTMSLSHRHVVLRRHDTARNKRSAVVNREIFLRLRQNEVKLTINPHWSIDVVWFAGLGQLLMKNLRFRDLTSNRESDSWLWI